MSLRVCAFLIGAAVAALPLPAAAQDVTPTPPPGWKVSDPHPDPSPAPGGPAATPPPVIPDYPPPPHEVQEARDLYNGGDFAAAFRKAFPFAEKGEPWAQNLVGQQYYYGRGVVQDCALALKWTLRAAEQAHPLALGNAGRMYDFGCYGEGVDDAQAAHWYDAAFQAGSLGYAADYARFLVSGRAGATDAERIAAVLAPAVAAGVHAALLAQAELRLAGKGASEDRAAALAWLGEQSGLGDQAASLVLARARIDGTDGHPPDPAAAFAALHGLTEAGYIPAAPYEALLRIEGGGDWADPVEGWALCHWAEVAAEPDDYAAAAAICKPLADRVAWQDKVKAALRGEKKAAR